MFPAQPNSFADESPPVESEYGATIGSTLVAVLAAFMSFVVVVDVVTYIDVARRYLARNVGHMIPLLAPFAVVEVVAIFICVFHIFYLHVVLSGNCAFQATASRAIGHVDERTGDVACVETFRPTAISLPLH